MFHFNQGFSGFAEPSIDEQADMYFRKFRPFMEDFESESVISRIRDITPTDIVNLGKQLIAWENYQELCESNGQLSDLGKIPQVALDVITIGYGTSPISTIASVQPIDEEKGRVYFKRVFARTSRGDVNIGDTLQVAGSVGNKPTPVGFASDTLETVMGQTTTSQDYTFNIVEVPIRPQYVEVTIPGLNLRAVDDGEGKLVGYDIQGEVDYETGALNISLKNIPTTGLDIRSKYATNWEAANTIPEIGFKWDSKEVTARLFALKGTTGLELEFAMKRRFGLSASEEITRDLIQNTNSEITSVGIRKLDQSAIGNTNWSKITPTGVGWVEHKQSFSDAISDVETVILSNAGQGIISTIVAGRNVAGLIGTLPGFVELASGNNPGPHIYGTYRGKTIVRCPFSQLLDPDQALCVCQGQTAIESPLVYSPFMPLAVNPAIPISNNPLVSQRVAVVWAALESLVPAYVSRLTITS